MERRSLVSALLAFHLACGPGSSKMASPLRSSTAEVARRGEGEVVEACGVFVLYRAPTIRSKRVATLVTHGKGARALATVHADKTALLATTVGDLDSVLAPKLCERFGTGPYLFHAEKEKGNLVGEIFVPLATPDRLQDAKVLCDHEALGKKIIPGKSAAEQSGLGLREAMGSLTTPAYRSLLARALQHKESQDMESLLRAVDLDLRTGGDATWDRCPLLMRK